MLIRQTLLPLPQEYIAANRASALTVIFTPLGRNLGCLDITIDCLENQLFKGENCFLICQLVIKLLTAKFCRYCHS